MSSLTNPRGPLPSGVYWRRRVLVIGVALLLVVGLGWLLTGASDGSDGRAGGSPDRDAATLVGQDRTEASATASTPAASPTVSAEPREAAGDRGRDKKGKKKKKRKAPLPAPEGECDPSDVTVRPVVRDAVAGKRVDIDLVLRTEESEACTWTVSADSVTLKITSGDDDIWFSSQCPEAVPEEDVVVRRDTRTRVTLPWDARRSDDGCTAQRLWAMPGWYHVQAAALAGEPADVQFELARPVSETITPTPDPEEKGDRDRDADEKDRDSDKKDRASKKKDRKKRR